MRPLSLCANTASAQVGLGPGRPEMHETLTARSVGSREICRAIECLWWMITS